MIAKDPKVPPVNNTGKIKINTVAVIRIPAVLITPARSKICKVKTINLRVGRLMAVIPENLDFLFDIMARGTALDGAKITIRKVPIRARCEACGADFEISEVYFLCPKCHSPKVDVLSGRELVIEDVEVM